MTQIDIETKNDSYPIRIGASIVEDLKSYQENYDKILLLSNTKLETLYEDLFTTKLASEKTEVYFLEDGEEYKTLASISKIYDFMLEKDFSRKSLICCIGGGVVCDMGGFVAASFMRGIDFIQVPTSLLAQVDASIGGKVAVNHEKGKNLIGFFYSPKAVLIDPGFLKTLEAKEWKSGMGEVIKHSILCPDDSYTSFLEKEASKVAEMDEEVLSQLIEQSCHIKQYYVEHDMTEKGIRAFLNFGHTYAHAVESIYHYHSISHGEAVAKGCLLDLYTSWKKGYLPKSYFERIQRLFALYHIDTEGVYFPSELLWTAMQKDKKNAFSKINTVLLKKEGKEKVFHLEEVEKQLCEDYLKESQNFTKAVIDIGSNSCRLFIAEVGEQGKSLEKILHQEVRIIQLGEGVHQNRYLLDTAIERCLHCLKDYKKTLESFGCKEVYCFATSATRDSKNREDFIAYILEETGIEIHCITGEEEAGYNFKGVSLAFSGRNLVVDIGGGSTEFSFGDKGELAFRKSLDMGAVRATEIFFPEQNYSEEAIAACRSWVFQKLQSLEEIKAKDFAIIAVAGTATTQVSVKEKMEVYDRKRVHGAKLSLGDLHTNLQLFLGVGVEERAKLTGLEVKRAPVIIAGSLILECILDYFQQSSLQISEYDNLMGAMVL